MENGKTIRTLVEIVIRHAAGGSTVRKRIMISYLGAYMLLLGLAAPAGVMAQIETDPALTAAVAFQTATIKAELDKQNTTQLAIAGIDAGIEIELGMVRQYTEKVYNYLSTVQGVVANAADIVTCLDMSVQILNSIGSLSEAVVDHPEGAFCTALIGRMTVPLVSEATALAGYVTSLVKKGGDTNLLNSYERTQILWKVKNSLWSINDRIHGVINEINFLRLRHVKQSLGSALLGNSYYDIVGAKSTCEQIKKEIGSLADRMKGVSY